MNTIGKKSNRGSGEQTLNVLHYLQIILREKWIVLTIFLCVFCITAIYTFTVRRVYQASASVLVDKRGQKAISPMLDIAGVSDKKDVQNELEILQSELLAENVAKELLNRKVVDSTTMEPIEIIKAPEDDTVSVPFASPREIATRLLKSAVTFDPVINSDVIKIIVKSHGAAEAALLANTYTEAYYDRNLFVSRIRSRTVREFLEGQLKERQKTLAEAENKLQSYMQEHGIVSLDDEAKKVISQLAQLEADRDAADIGIQSSMKTLESYQQEIAAQEPNVAKAIGEANDPYISLLQAQIAKLEVERDVTVAQNPGNTGEAMYNQRFNEINAQIVKLRGNLQKRTTEYLQSLIPEQRSIGNSGSPQSFLSEAKLKVLELKIEIQQIQAKKKALEGIIVDYEKQFNSLPQKGIAYARLERTRLSNEKLYLLLDENYNEAQVKEKSDFGYINIIDPAIVPLEPISPRVRLNLLLGLIAGLGLGIATAIVRESINVRVGTPDDLRNRGYVMLTAVALMNSEIKRLGGKSTIERDGRVVDVHLISFVNPLSTIAEAYRRLRTNIQYAQIDNTISTLLVTSPNPGEGKSTTVSNLAITFAQAGKKVLLVDTDLRKPTLHIVFNIKKEPGIVDVLFGSASLDSAIHDTPVTGLDLICCGTIPLNPSEMLGSQKMKDLVEDFKKRYDIILFDAPPLLATADPLVLSMLVDGIVLVTSSGRTPLSSLERALDSIQSVGSRYLGIVLNNFDLRTVAGYYRYGYGYGYGKESYGNLPGKPMDNAVNRSVSSLDRKPK
jgi:capsular exopolysaccharide synthesis family protein